MVDIDAYLGRIGYRGALAPTETCLAALHEAHLAAIPFENLDVVRGHGVRLDLASLEAKLLRDRRGGYCFEQNTLFKAVLDRIGFGTRILIARVRLGLPPGSTLVTARSHMVLKVETPGGAYLADVGFGADGLLRPIPLLPEIVHHMPDAAFRLRQDGREWILEGDVGRDRFSDYYAFTLEAQHPIDIEVANHYTATHPESKFRQILTAQQIQADRRLALRDYRLEIHRHGTVETRELADEAERLALLATEFGLDFPPGTCFAPALD
jgi:N-hydroxyarylamine O-acetyltransferase